MRPSLKAAVVAGGVFFAGSGLVPFQASADEKTQEEYGDLLRIYTPMAEKGDPWAQVNV